MMIGTVPTSVPQFVLLGNWLLEGDFKKKWDQVKTNKLFWILSSVFLIHVLGLIHTSDFGDGLKDVKTKMPLMFLPLIFLTTSPLTKKEFHFLLYCFIAGSLVNITWCYIYSLILHKNEVARSASRFMSHIRLGLYLNVAICTCVYFIAENKKIAGKMLNGFFILLFLFSMYALGLASGVANFLILVVCGGIYLIRRQKRNLKLILSLALISGVTALSGYVFSVYESQVQLNKTSYNTIQAINSNGRWYSQFSPVSLQKENGNYVMINIQFEELKREWNKRVITDTFSYTPQHNLQRFEVLLRYLSSREYTKDSLGISKLNKTDLENIGNDICNYRISQWSYLHKRVYELVNEYDEFVNGRNINGHSLSMRPFFWQAAIQIIKKNYIIGVGTGDVQSQLNKTYPEINSPLKEDWFKRPHNQYLTITVALGIVGLIVFLVSLVWPLVRLKKHLNILYYPFFLIALISFLLEDTLETQAGLTYFAFFNVLFLTQAWWRKEEIKTQHTPAD